MRSDTRQNWDWADTYMGTVEAILSQHLAFFVDIKVADVESDTKRATDLILSIDADVSMALRLRRSAYDERDLTIRCWNRGYKTEWHKIESGFVSHYFYGWTCEDGTIPEWMLIDVQCLRDSGLLNNRKPIYNKDKRTAFIAIGYRELSQAGCILAMNIGGVA